MLPSSSDDALAPRPRGAAGATFVSRTTVHGGAGADPGATMRVLDGVADALARWFGPFGYHALLTRALAHARAAHPALTGVRVRAPLTPLLDGVTEAAQAYGGEATTAGVAAVIEEVINLVGSVIGDDVTLQLLESHMDRPAHATADPAPDRTGGSGAPTDRASADARRRSAP